ncbi:tRNA (adenosine(37)-N6)-threonylcarbamoyltransferase complex ATPase subunit type 1 TsaE [Nocardioides sp. AE5]|uniref:tRNA (adenosine(37)-N6)-threonylcarbamoyltransferase complex ATPase subunit type 1 TsaE n=1 Tax=Nocardioides sp. AE5 TaxID=2962573 RepID=UPI00288170FC|nr:tRNA (adenosine(37)-N6)-threonylcarbamoyltransferase complex ATPase subunit type 1 TsaE [Nocardioides sp. AE5]MDT0202056.1 tRNA (adenosine(37)-N6)-threonylcarbamoyltransferase complex ATPase subunit type 1 TsaE [Nocardioides sp. AE5]
MTRVAELVGAEAAGEMHRVIAEAFGARPVLDPPAEALAETPESLAVALAAGSGIVVREDGEALGSLVLERNGDTVTLRRVGVLPRMQGSGVAGELVAAAEAHARAQGATGMQVVARVELPASVAFWEHNGFVRSGREGEKLSMTKVFPRTFTMATPEDAHAFGERLAGLLRAGDLVILAGELGAGKTTFTKGIGAGLGVRGDVASPTFVIARVHPSLVGGPGLVHVDAYRLGSIDELDELDLEMTMAGAVTVVEWGAGLAEGLAEDRLEIDIVRTLGDVASIEDTDERQVVIRPVGARWLDVDWSGLAAYGREAQGAPDGGTA